MDDTKEAAAPLPSPLFVLDSSQPIYLGQLPKELEIRGRGYTGCISDLVVRDKYVETLKRLILILSLYRIERDV